MKESMKFLAAMLFAVLFVGCSKDDPGLEPDPKPTTYAVTYNLDISDDFFELGTFTVTYADKEGKEQVRTLTGSEKIIVEGLTEESRIFMDVSFSYDANKEYTKEQYVLSKEIGYLVTSSKGDVFAGSDLKTSTTVNKDKIKDYLEIISEREMEIVDIVIKDKQ